MPPPSLIIVGGGLAGGLCAVALAKLRPEVHVTLVESGERIGGNHIWSFFESDLSPHELSLISELLPNYWPSHEVRFPAHRRHIDSGYFSVESALLDRAVRAWLPADAIIRGEAVSLSASSVTLGNGSIVEADAVLDARGLSGPPNGLVCGWQKFVGQLLDVPDGHGLAAPVIMDATVDQAEGYRFVYCLPFTTTNVLIEDTYYSDTPQVNRDMLASRIAAYAKSADWTAAKVLNEESGVLPVVMGGDFDGFWPAADTIARAGVRAGLFHPLTSYSLPDAVRFALWLARDASMDSTLGPATRTRASAHWKRGAFHRLLAKMLLRAADPSKRYRVLERFYRLPAPLISRFYSGRSTFGDRVRLLVGKPPVSIRRAIAALREQV